MERSYRRSRPAGLQKEWRQAQQHCSSLVKPISTDKESTHKVLLILFAMSQAVPRLRGLEVEAGQEVSVSWGERASWER